MMRRLVPALVAAALGLGLGVPVVEAANSLQDPAISPPNGTTATDFTFSVRYVSDEAHVPSWVRVSVAGVDDFDLTLVSGTSTNGTYAITLRLPAGTRAVTFRADASQGADPFISGGSVTVTEAPPTPAPTATPAPTPTPMPTSIAAPSTPLPTGTSSPTRPPTATPSPSPSMRATPAASVAPAPSPTTAEGVLGGTPAASPAPSGAARPGDFTPAQVAGLASRQPSAGGPAQPADDDSGRVPVGAIWLLVGCTISMSGAGMLAVLAVRHQRRAHLRRQ